MRLTAITIAFIVSAASDQAEETCKDQADVKKPGAAKTSFVAKCSMDASEA